MKKIIVLFFTLAVIFARSYPAIAQHKALVNINTVKKDGNTIDFTLSSTKPFLVGDNVYVLNIGDKEFAHSRQSSANGKGTITFLIPVEDFNALNEGASVYLTYGHLKKGAQNMEELSKRSNFPAWSLGTFSKDKLNK